MIPFSLIKGLFVLGSLFVLSQFFINTDIPFKYKLLDNSLYFAKYVFIFLMAVYVTGIEDSKETIHKAITLILVFLKINFVAILLGVVFKIDLFLTYGHNRFGYDGLIQINSHASYIYCFATIYVIYNFIKTKKTTLDFWVIILSSLLIGTKTLYLFYALIGCYLFFYFKLYKKLVFYIFSFGLISFIIFYNENVITFLNTHFRAFFKLYYECGFFTAITSTRNLLLVETLSLAFNEYWVPLNYVIGGSFFAELRTEMAFIDLLLFWGILGTILYLYLYYKHIIRYYMHHSFLKYAIVSVMVTAFLGGNFFTNAVIAIYIVVFTSFFKLNSKV
ncbi:hypothetical protein [Psychroserpens mesophilus]|uniref:hypothetical protein n=1 Tax=Psychroserpens mesophilus TaxID=325473 RepID=UPI003D645F12